jgi:hypothetical protein
LFGGDMPDETQEKTNEEKGHFGVEEIPMMFGGVTSFAELEETKAAQDAAAEVQDLTGAFQAITANIMADEEITDKAAAMSALTTEFTQRTQAAMTKERWQPLTDAVKNKVADITKQETKTEGGVSYPAADFAFVPDRERPSGWKLRLAEGRPGNITVQQLGRAAAAFSPGGFRGRRVQIPTDAVSSVKARIRREYRKLDVDTDDIPDSVKELKPPENSFMVKELDDGGYRWTAIYSNNFRDEDNPPEIISAASHRRFEKMVDGGEVPYPELWYWHNKDWKLGTADLLGWDDRGFAVATGLFDESAHSIAKMMITHPELCDGVSHGMSRDSIKRDSNDSSIIVEHITHEISPLPQKAAANKLTGFIMDNKEADIMALSEEKEAAFAKLNVNTDEATAKNAETAAELELESKEKAEPEPETTDEVKALREEVGDLVKEIGGRLTQLITVVEAQQKKIDELARTDQEKVKEAAELTPAASLTDMFNSSIGSQATKMDGSKGRNVTANKFKGPAEAQPLPAVGEYGIGGVVQRAQAAKRQQMEVSQ